MIAIDELLTIKEASEWATKHIGKMVTTSNISYLIQYGRIKRIGDNGSTQVSKQDLTNYYKSYNAGLQIVKQYKHPVLYRTETDKGTCSEIINKIAA